MQVTKKEIPTAVEQKKKEINEYLEKKGNHMKSAGMLPCVYVLKISVRKYHVGFAFCKNTQKAGEEYTTASEDIAELAYVA